MEDKDKTIETLMNELAVLRQAVADLKGTAQGQARADDVTNRLSEANYTAIFDAANDAIFVHDIASGRILDINRKAAEMYCYPKEEMLGLDVGKLSLGEPPYSQNDAIRMINEAASGEPQVFEWLAKDKYDRTFWVEVSLKRAVIGGKYRMLAIVRDITERKRTEERLEKINEVFLNFGTDSAENINRLTALCGELLGADCALYNRLDGGFLHSCGQWNVPEGFNSVDSAEGHICTDVINRGSDEVIVIRNLPETGYAKTDPNVAQYNPQTYIGHIVKFGGEYVGSLCVVYKYDFDPTEEDKKIMGIIASAIGIEEERQKVVETAELAEFSIQRAADSIFWIGQDARILYVNDATCDNLGYSRDELLNMSIPDIDPNFPHERWPLHWKELLERHSFTFETVHRRKDGATFPVEVTVNYLQFDGYEYNCAFARNITERKKQEEDLWRRGEQLEILSRTSQHINAVLEIDTITRTLVAGAMEVVGATGGMAGIVENGKVIFREYNKDGKPEKISYELEIDRGIPGQLAKTLKPYMSNDAEHDEHILPEKKKQFGLYNLVSVPILNHKGEALGCFEMHNKESRIPFDAQDVFMLQGLAASAAIAIDNAHMLVELRRSEGALRDSEAHYRAIVEDQTELICRYDNKGVISFVNEAYCRYFGKPSEEMVGHDFFRFLPQSEIGRVKRNLASLTIKKPFLTHEHKVIAAGGEIRWQQWTNRAIIDSSGNITDIQAVGRDITERHDAENKLHLLYKELKKSNRKLRQLALKDPQTGLYNSRYLNEFIDSEFYRAMRYAHPLSVIMLDIDYFKSINELYGHDFGDMVLEQLAAYLKKIVRKYDIVVRFSGEEFVVISPGVNRPRAIQLAQRFLDAINLYNFGNKRSPIKLKLSISVASYPEDKIAKGTDLINVADRILNRVKDEGGNKVYSSEALARKGRSLQKEQVEPEEVRALKERIEKLTKKGKENLTESIFAFAKTIELKDHYTGEHGENTVRYATDIAKAMKLPPEEIDSIKEASILHDLGKIGISDKILLKKSKLTKNEFEEVKRHPQIAADIIRPIHFMHDIVPLILYHHERWDGKGYPTGLKNDQIPVGARIISVADVYQALTSNRPYRKAFSKKEAIEIIREGSGVQFDPVIVDIFLKILKKER